MVANDPIAKASSNFDQAIRALDSHYFADTPSDVKEIWAMANWLHLDMGRTLMAMSMSQPGPVKLLWMADSVSRLFEAKRWYFEKGIPLILSIASRTSQSLLAETQTRITQLKTQEPIGKIERYANYRNKISFHYDRNALQHLQEFGKLDSGEFTSIVTSFLYFSRSFAEVVRDVLGNPPKA
ncbi:hypothetical protein [Solilutibacter oculi]|nr:hypothetical protein [Lysobacter oculi]